MESESMRKSFFSCPTQINARGGKLSIVATRLVLLLLAAAGMTSHTAQGGEIPESLAQSFAEPPRELASRPLWFWNVPMISAGKTDEITRASAEESGYAGFGILPCFGPKNNFQGGDVYLTEEYFERYGAALDAARRYGMKMCLYDEYWFPSGAAGGWLREKFPEAVMQELVCEEQTLEATERGNGIVALRREGESTNSGMLMAVVAIHSETGERIPLSMPAQEAVRSRVFDKQVFREIPAGTWRILSFYCRPSSQPLVDYLNPDAVRRFIELTHDEYYRRFPEYFGTTIDSVFYDEPPLYRVNTWTPGFNRAFREKHAAEDTDPALLYPDLFFDLDETTPHARALMFGLRSELFATAYIGQMNEWCLAHGVKLTGHMDQEQIQNPTATCGDLMYSFRHQAIPGIDEIVHFGRTQNAYKLISSAATNWDQPLVMSETYGAIGGMPVNDLYRIAMDQYAKGINLLVPHAVWYDDDPKTIIFEPELSWRHPVYGPELPAFNRFVARLNLLLQRGTPVVDIAVFYPITTLNAGYHFGMSDPYQGGDPVPEADYLTVGENLSLHVRRDFTYLHPEALGERCVVEPGDAGRAGLQLQNETTPQEYRTLILPGMRIMDIASLRKVKEFFDANGRVIATTQLPWLAAEGGKNSNEEVRRTIREIFGVDPAQPMPTTPVTHRSMEGVAIFLPEPTHEALRTALEEFADSAAPPDVILMESVSVEDGNLTYIHRRLPECEVYFFANSSATSVATLVRLRGTMTLQWWNPMTGEQQPLDATSVLPEPTDAKNAGKSPESSTEFTLRLAPRSCGFVIGTKIASEP